MKLSRLGLTLLTVALVGTLSVPAAAGALPLAPVGRVWKTLPTPSVPSWVTPELHRQVVAAGPKGLPIPSEANIPVSSLAFLGIRPGQLIILYSSDGSTISLCTANFLFTNGTQHFIGTAGHCGLAGDDVDMLFLPSGLVNIGKVVYSTGDGDVGNDFALISIDPALNQWVSPSMAFWGGPTGAYTGSGPAVVEHTGWGLVVGTGGTPRVGLGVDWTPNEWVFEGVISFGDSGSGANVLGGLAAGNITHIAVNFNTLTVAAGTSIQKILQLLAQHFSNQTFSLETCPSALPWPLAGCP